MSFVRLLFVCLMLSALVPQAICGQVAATVQQIREELAMRAAALRTAEMGDPGTPPESPEIASHKRPGQAFLMSALVPGAGQAYNGAWKTAVPFIAVEAGAWIAYGNFHSRGMEIEDEYEAYADANWVESDYWDWISQQSGIDRRNMEELRQWERNRFSHHLPEDKNQEYYENVGKYDQFNVGWRDTQNGMARDSAMRSHYDDRRHESNKNLKRASLSISMAMINHLFSGLHAAYGSVKHNRQQGGLGFRLEHIRYSQEWVPAGTLTLKF